MSRTNPYKKKRRSASKTLLIFGEGLGEEMFLKHLRKLYAFNNDIAITIKKGKGGDARNIIIDASKIIGAYDRKIVVLDNDKSAEEMKIARQEAKKKKIELIENTPCLEYLLLLILEEQTDKTNSKLCKQIFESKYIDRKKRNEPDEYNKLFTKKLLDKKRLKINELDNLLLIMEGVKSKRKHETK